MVAASVPAQPARVGRAAGREHRRAPHRVPCRLRYRDPASGQVCWLVGETVNVSAGGLAVQVGKDVSAGTQVEALMPGAGDQPQVVCGTVSHSRRVLSGMFELGIRFTDLRRSAVH